MFSAVKGAKIFEAIPGVSGIPISVIFESSSEDDIPLTIALSIVLSSFVKNVPKLFEKYF